MCPSLAFKNYLPDLSVNEIHIIGEAETQKDTYYFIRFYSILSSCNYSIYIPNYQIPY